RGCSVLLTIRRPREHIKLSTLKKITRCGCRRLGSSILNRAVTAYRRDLQNTRWRWITIVFELGGLSSMQGKPLPPFGEQLQVLELSLPEARPKKGLGSRISPWS